MRFSTWTTAALVASLAFTAACGDDEEENGLNDNRPMTGNDNDNDNDNDNGNGNGNQDPNLVEVVATTADLSSLLTVITYIDANGSQADTADLATLLSGTGPFTVFAPNNAAFDAALDLDDSGLFDTGDVTELETALGGATAAADALYLVVANHATNGRVLSTDLTNGQQIDTLAGAYDPEAYGILVDTTSGVVVSGSYDAAPATVVGADVTATNGVAHVVDEIILDEATAAALGLPEDDPNLVDLVAETPSLSSLLTVITYIDANGSQAASADLATLLSGTGPFTVFAPNNAAFDAALDLDDSGLFDTGDVTELETALGGATAAADALYLVVANHATNGRVLSTDLTNGQQIDTLAGAYDPEAYGILVDTTSGVVVSGSYDAAPATVVGADVTATNGVAHVVDEIILDEATAAALGLPEDDPNLVDLVAETPSLSSLLTVITYIDANGSQADTADLATLLSGTGPFTVFAPNNAAFDAALDLDGSGTFDTADVAELEALLGDAQTVADALYLVVANHAVSGAFLSTDLNDGDQLATLAGAYDPSDYGILVDTTSGVVVSGSYDADPATVVGANVGATNGVAHVIDQIILDEATAAALGLPEDENLVEIVAATPSLSSLLTVITYIDENGSQADTADLATLLSGAGPFTVFVPNNTAFEALSQDADGDFDADDITALETALGGATAVADALYLVVANHAVSGAFLSTDLNDGDQLATLAGPYDPAAYGILVDTTSGVVVTGSYDAPATVALADVPASNGVAHVIDALIIDEATEAALGLPEDD